MKDSTSFDVHPFINLYAMDTICETALGTKINAQINSNSEYVTAVRQLINIIIYRMVNPFKQLKIMYMCFPSYWKQAKLIQMLHNRTESIIAKRRKLHAEGNFGMKISNGYQSKTKITFIDMLIAGNINGVPLTDKEICEEVETFMFEGQDTVSTALSFTIYLISIHPDVQDKIHKELLRIFGDDNNRHTTFEELQNMTYLETVIKESLRLYPPIPAISRYVSEDTDFGTIKIKANTGVFMSPYFTHRIPEYFPEPEKFMPERFSAENIHNIKPFSYLPFSGGFRNCIGKRFAMLEIKSVLSRIIRNFEIFPDPNFEPKIIGEILLMSTNGIRIKLKKRI